MKRILAAAATLALALGLASAPAAVAAPVVPGSDKLVTQISAPAKTPAELYGNLTAAEHAATFSKKAATPTARLDSRINKGQPPAPKPPSAKAKAACTPPGAVCYLYNGGRQDITNTLGTGTPKVSDYRGVNANVKVCGHSGALHGATDYHTLCEISATAAAVLSGWNLTVLTGRCLVLAVAGTPGLTGLAHVGEDRHAAPLEREGVHDGPADLDRVRLGTLATTSSWI